MNLKNLIINLLTKRALILFLFFQSGLTLFSCAISFLQLNEKKGKKKTQEEERRFRKSIEEPMYFDFDIFDFVRKSIKETIYIKIKKLILIYFSFSQKKRKKKKGEETH